MDTNQETPLIVRLFNSFGELEKAIEVARKNLSKNANIPEEVFERLNSYSSVVQKQKTLAHQLFDHIQTGNTLEIGRHVNLINNLSSMIICDAKSVLGTLSNEIQVEGKDEGLNFC